MPIPDVGRQPRRTKAEITAHRLGHKLKNSTDGRLCCIHCDCCMAGDPLIIQWCSSVDVMGLSRKDIQWQKKLKW